jgi:tRNA A37 threonylcarbamoyladenosine modification protein TsaB
VYWAAYDSAGLRVTGPHVNRPVEVAETLYRWGAVAATGEGAKIYADILQLPLIDVHYPSPLALVIAAREALITNAVPQPLTPLYLRRADAVELAERKRVSPR